MPRKKQTDIEQPQLIAEEAAEYIVSPDEEALRAEYRQRLAEALKDPEFRKIEGFPIGEDEAILALSDPPYYTACPNPFLNEIVEKWRQERTALRDELGLPNDEPAGSKYVLRENMPTKNYHREPFAADVSEGKNDPIYNAHSYHTKVPHKAIMRYILHYTDPGDIVLDGFCGTGMTGIAAQLCGDKKTIESLGYTVKEGKVFDENNKHISWLGSRKPILSDLSPVAAFIAFNYNNPVNARAFEKESKRILKEINSEFGWMYETKHIDGKTEGLINYTVWSDVFICSNCGNEMIFSDVGIDKGNILDAWNCPNCSALLSKSPSKNDGAQKVERAWETIFDRSLGHTVRRTKQVPILINYSVNGEKFEKQPDQHDLELIRKIEDTDFSLSYPAIPMMLKGEQWGDTWRAGYHSGITHIHHFFTTRSTRTLAAVFNKIDSIAGELRNYLLYAFEQAIPGMSKWARYVPSHYSQVNQGLSGTLYIGSQFVEPSLDYILSGKIKRLGDVLRNSPLFRGKSLVTNQSSTHLGNIQNNTLDYVFVDPPFGSNLMYSELNFLTEAWLRTITNNSSEAIVNQTQHKGLPEYQALMENCFIQFFRVLKPGRWITIEFHNSQNSVWNSIQEAVMRAGFVVADVRTLDKQQGTFKQITSNLAVKQDLIISAYKPTAEFESTFFSEAGSEQGGWDFIRQHLEQLPLPNVKNGALETLQERFPYLLYDRMVAFHIQRGLTIPLSAPEFYQGLSQRFLEREGMVFTAAQAAAYDKLRLQAERVEQLALFVTDESSARQWLRQELEHEPKTYGDLQPKFVQQLHQSKYEDLPELKVILEQAFLQDDKGRWYVPDPERAADLEKLRQNALLREFNEYRKGKGRLKVFRSEAIRAGFSNAWREREYDVIVEIAERMPESVLQEDQQLLMYYHNARLRQSSQPRQENLL